MQARSSLIAAVLALAVAVAVGIFVGLDRPAQNDSESAHDDSAAADASIKVNRSHELAPQTESAKRGAVATDDPSYMSRDFAEHVDVEIVSAKTRAPLPNAKVWCWPRRTQGDGERGFESWLRQGTLEQHQTEALELRSDDQGHVRVPNAALGFHVAALSGELWGAASFAARPEQLPVVALAPNLELRVRVIDSQGAPVAGVPVALRQRRMTRTFDALTARTEAPDGTAILRHAGHYLGAASTSPPEFVFAVRGLFDPPLETSLEQTPDSSELPTLVLPPSGSCEVVVVDVDDQPVRGPLDARLRFSDASENGAVPPGYESLASRSAEALVFEQVALGRSLAVEVFREGSNSTLEARGPGPRKAGERVSLRVALGASVANLRGRLLDAEGIPCAGATARAQFESSMARAGFDAIRAVETRANGEFAFDITPVPEVPDGAVLAVHRTSEEGVEQAVGRRPLPRALTAGSYDLGDFVLIETPIAVAGIVIDASGKPVAGAAVTAAVAFDAKAEPAEQALRGPWLHPARSDEQGQFEIRCELWTGKLSVVAQKEGLAGDPQIVSPGTRGVRLVVSAEASIEGRVLLDRSLLDSMVLVEASRDETMPAPAPMPSGKPAVLAADGGFKIAGLRAGSFLIRVIFAATGAELGRVSNLAVRTGETTRDARADPLDLRGKYRLLDLEPIDERAEPIRDARAFSRSAGDSAAKWIAAPRQAGHLLLLSDGRPLDVAISAAGYLRAEFEGINASQKVTLRRAPKLRLQLAGGLRVPDPPLYLGVELIPLEAGRFPGLADGGLRYFDELGELACQFAFAGDVRVELSVALRKPGAESRQPLEGQLPRIISVAEHSAEQVFEVSFDRAQLESAARALRGEN